MTLSGIDSLHPEHRETAMEWIRHGFMDGGPSGIVIGTDENGLTELWVHHNPFHIDEFLKESFEEAKSYGIRSVDIINFHDGTSPLHDLFEEWRKEYRRELGKIRKRK